MTTVYNLHNFVGIISRPSIPVLISVQLLKFCCVITQLSSLVAYLTRGQSNLTKSASRGGGHSPVRGHPRWSKFVPLNSWGRGSY